VGYYCLSSISVVFQILRYYQTSRRGKKADSYKELMGEAPAIKYVSRGLGLWWRSVLLVEETEVPVENESVTILTLTATHMSVGYMDRK
jgi:hypothetical protein